ncbi:MAG: hypothetical protein PHW96_02035 [Candidatus Nanoarchaeia archaeon]|nr:hypothetical protein [Candidatus Nanoarchaeia archaeon]
MNIELTESEIKEIGALVSKKLEGILWVVNNKEVQNKEELQKRAKLMKELLDKLGVGFNPRPQKQQTKF